MAQAKRWFTQKEIREFKRDVKSGKLKPEDVPGKGNEALRLLIRATR